MAPTGTGTRFHKALYKPQSMIDYIMAITQPLVETRLLDVILIEASIDLGKSSRRTIIMGLSDFTTGVPVRGDDSFREVLQKYGPVLDTLAEGLDNNIKQFAILFNKALNTGASKEELDSLGYFLGELQGEFVSLIKRIGEYSSRQVEELAVKYMSHALQRITARFVQQLTEGGAVLCGVCTLNRLRLMWIPQQEGVVNRGAYDVPGSKLQALSLLKNIIPGLIDYSNEENEYTRVARLSQVLSDERDLDTLIGLITRLYLGPDNAGLPRQLEEGGWPKRYIPLVLLSYVLTRERGVYTLVDFEGNIPIVLSYPKIPATMVVF